MKMRTSGIWIMCTGLAMASCSGSYQVGFEPGAGGAGGGTDAGNAAGAGGGTAGGGAGGSTGGTAQIDAAGDVPVPSRCSFTPDTMGDPAPSASSMVVASRIYRFLDDSTVIPPGALPPQPTAAWAAELATSILDGHFAARTEARGLARFLTSWLALPNADAGPSAAHTWALRLVDPKATLATLLSEPTGVPHRLGILTDTQVLTARPRITPRGVWMNAHLFCNVIPPPPPDTPLLPPMGVTRRERHESQVSPPECMGCHVDLDPPGDSLEHFDALGNYSDLDNGKAVDSSGTIRSPMMSFMGFDDFAPQLAQNCVVAHCITQALLDDSFEVSAPANRPFTEQETNHVANAFANSNFSIRALVEAIVATPSFLR
jgi:hypothetical protein